MIFERLRKDERRKAMDDFLSLRDKMMVDGCEKEFMSALSDEIISLLEEYSRSTE